MIKIEDGCVECGLPCLGINCTYKKVRISHCDRCDSTDVIGTFDGEDLCKSCAFSMIKTIFYDMTLWEQAEACGVNVTNWR